MEETNVNRLNGIPYWGHGTMENLENGITPTNEVPVELEVAPIEPEEIVETPEIDEPIVETETPESIE